jgi:amino acid adenylation domain-containing protein
VVPERSPIVGAVDDLVTEQCDFGPSELEAASDAPLQDPIAPDAVAHLLFTSGSTGLPKAVAVTHANVRHFVDWAVRYFDILPGERVSGHAPFHFDLSTFDIYGALSAGAEVHLVPPALNLLPAKLADFIASRELEQWFSVPTTLTQLANADAIAPGSLPDLKRMLWCGEAIPLPTLRSLMATLPAVQFTNLYGPTETTIASSFFTVDEPPETDASSVSIGQPLPGEDLVILGEGDEPAAQGEVAELCISGAGLTNGYWLDAERTAEAFVTDPRGGGGRLYRTGDLARVGPDGRIYLLGRLDHQVKIRGYRIELGEIEAPSIASRWSMLPRSLWSTEAVPKAWSSVAGRCCGPDRMTLSKCKSRSASSCRATCSPVAGAWWTRYRSAVFPSGSGNSITYRV